MALLTETNEQYYAGQQTFIGNNWWYTRCKF